MRHNRSQTRQRRSHHALKAPTLSTCANCSELHRPHHMCLNCGFYKGRQVMDLVAAREKREARLKAKREMISAEAGVSQEPTPAAPHDTRSDEKTVRASALKRERAAERERTAHSKEATVPRVTTDNI